MKCEHCGNEMTVEQVVLRLVRKNSGVTAKMVARCAGVLVPTASNVLSRMHRRGVLDRLSRGLYRENA